MREVIKEKLLDALASAPPRLTRREARLPGVPNKVHAIIGMRRAGKTCFLHQCLKDRLDAGAPRASLVYFNFEDERLGGMELGQFAWVLEEYFLLQPQFRDQRQVTFFFDEVQLVTGWEMFVRRIYDSEKVEVFVSGSSAKLLSREVATSLRGRGMETIIFPFSFREYLLHHGVESPERPTVAGRTQRSKLERAFGQYLRDGGFPEAQGKSERERIPLLQGYVDTTIYRDVVERRGITNVVALRRLVRQLLGAPGGLFSVHRFHNDLRSQGVGVAKDAVHEMLGHLEDTFLVRVVPLATDSERQRQVNPRKVYPVDPALIPAFDQSGKANVGHALETAVLIELERRKCEVGYVYTPGGYEVDFLARSWDNQLTLIQVAADLSVKETREREFRALADALPAYRRAKGLVLALSSTDALQAQADAPKGVQVRPAWEWFLERPEQ